jgi:glycosyltransferase involved in cell wall biosynthesis
MLRVKNEARWIKRSIESIAPLCNAGIWVLDDNSTDDTLELAWAAGACVIPSPFVTLNEARDKNMLLQMALHAKPDWIICIDGDEELSGDYRDNLALTMRTTRAYSISLPIWYLWDRPDQLRVDGVYGNFHRESVFRPVPGARFHEAGSGPNFHCGNVPSIPPSLRDRREVVNAPLLHYGYMERDDRLRKYSWYNAKDPDNRAEDCYRHMVQGDIVQVPADAVLKHAGPLKLRAI